MYQKAQKVHLGFQGRREKDAQAGKGIEGSLLCEPAGKGKEQSDPGGNSVSG